MAKLESYSNLSKQQEDLIKKGFSFGQLLDLTVYAKTPQSINFKSSFKHGNDNLASTYFNYKTPSLSLKEELKTSKVFKGTLEFVPDNYKDAKGKIEIEHNAAEGTTKETGSVEYTHEKFKSKLAITNDIALKLSTVVGIKQGGVGVDLAFDTNKKRFVAYNAAFWWFTDTYRLVFKHISVNKAAYSFGNLSASVFYNWSPVIKIGGAAVYDPKKKLDVKL